MPPHKAEAGGAPHPAHLPSPRPVVTPAAAQGAARHVLLLEQPMAARSAPPRAQVGAPRPAGRQPAARCSYRTSRTAPPPPQERSPQPLQLAPAASERLKPQPAPPATSHRRFSSAGRGGSPRGREGCLFSADTRLPPHAAPRDGGGTAAPRPPLPPQAQPYLVIYFF